MAEYRLSPAAERDIESIWKFSADNWGVDQANLYADLLHSDFAKLAHSPQLAQACDAVRPGLLRYRVHRHIAYFRIAKYGIAIIRILHSRMKPSKHL